MKCTVYGAACPVHGFFHGAEAEELREGVEKIIKHLDDEDRGARTRHALQRLLDTVDARDSVAYLEAIAKERDDAR